MCPDRDVLKTWLRVLNRQTTLDVEFLIHGTDEQRDDVASLVGNIKDTQAGKLVEGDRVVVFIILTFCHLLAVCS